MNDLKSHREIKRISWVTVQKLISILHENTRMKKTLLATSCGMGYDKCRRYIDWLEMMELIKREINNDDFEEIILTEKGRSLFRKKFNA